MPKVDRRALIRAFRWDGWLDRETGEILECDKKQESDGTYRYIIPEKMQKNRARYVRIPYLDYVQFSLDMIEEGIIPEDKMRKYGIHKIEYRNDSHLFFIPYDQLRGLEASPEGDDLYDAVYQMTELDDEMAERISEWSDVKIWPYIEQWVNEMGCELSESEAQE